MIPQLIIVIRAVIKYPECRFRIEYLWNRGRIGAIFAFAGARSIGTLADLVISQGQSIMVNKYLGPVFNATQRIGQMVVSQAGNLSSALSGAFWPAIANKVGENDFASVCKMSFQVCRIGTGLILVFAIPLALECDVVLEIWLKSPPEFAVQLCIAMLFCVAFGRMGEGYWMAILGKGNGIVRYSIASSMAGFVGFVVTWLSFTARLGMWSVCLGVFCGKVVTLVARLWYGQRLAGLATKKWVIEVLLPITFVTFSTVAVAWPLRIFMEGSVCRVLVTTLVCEIAF